MGNKSMELMGRMGLINRSIMLELYGIYSNERPLQPLNESTINRLLGKHGDSGYVILSANRDDEDNVTNNENTRKLIRDIRSTGRSYLPVYGGYRGTDNLVDSFEPSFAVFNFDRKGEPMDFDNLKTFGC